MLKPSPGPYWDDVSLPKFPPLRRSFDADVVVVGAGLTGSPRRCCSEAGLRVALVERGRVGGIDTGCTTAHLTPVVDARLDTLASRSVAITRRRMGRRLGRDSAGRRVRFSLTSTATFHLSLASCT